MKKKISLSLAVSLMALTSATTFVLSLGFCSVFLNGKLGTMTRLGDKYDRLNELDQIVQKEFYKDDIAEEDLIDQMLAGYIAGLGDPYSAYRSDKELHAYQDNNAGVYTGIGIAVRQEETGDVLIVSVTEEGSAAKAGIQAGDYLVAVEGIDAKTKYREAIEAIAGDVNTEVKLLIRKGDTGAEQTVSVARKQLDEITVSSEMLENNIGYIRISKFRTVTVEQFETARKELLAQGAEGFIFDVRNNGGGVVAALEKMVDPILPKGELAFAYTKDGASTTIVESDAAQTPMPYVVLVNGNSASAAELFACVLRDYGGAKLVGEKTFGKGIMQTTFELSSGGVTLTTATYATGKTPCYHGVGLEPDVQSVLAEDATEDTQRDDALRTIKEMIAAEKTA